MNEQALYFYKAELVHVVDGDTFDLHIDLGFYSRYSARFRLMDYDTPELNRGSDYEKLKGMEAKRFAFDWFGVHEGGIYVGTYKADSFGRWLVDVYGKTGDSHYSSLGQKLYEKGLATEWPTKWREEYDD